MGNIGLDPVKGNLFDYSLFLFSFSLAPSGRATLTVNFRAGNSLICSSLICSLAHFAKIKYAYLIRPGAGFRIQQPHRKNNVAICQGGKKKKKKKKISDLEQLAQIAQDK